MIWPGFRKGAENLRREHLSAVRRGTAPASLGTQGGIPRTSVACFCFWIPKERVKATTHSWPLGVSSKQLAG